ncbi:MAG: hypothetical protein ACR2ME_02370 [Acidimicrobiia bacterium]
MWLFPWGTGSGLISAGKYQPNRGLDATGGKKVGETSAVEVVSSAAHQSMGRERIRLDLCQRGQDLLGPRSGGPPRAVELPSWMHGRPAGSPSHQATTASAPIYAVAIVDVADELDYLGRVQRLGSRSKVRSSWRRRLMERASARTAGPGSARVGARGEVD